MGGVAASGGDPPKPVVPAVVPPKAVVPNPPPNTCDPNRGGGDPNTGLEPKVGACPNTDCADPTPIGDKPVDDVEKTLSLTGTAALLPPKKDPPVVVAPPNMEEDF